MVRFVLEWIDRGKKFSWSNSLLLSWLQAVAAGWENCAFTWFFVTCFHHLCLLPDLSPLSVLPHLSCCCSRFSVFVMRLCCLALFSPFCQFLCSYSFHLCLIFLSHWLLLLFPAGFLVLLQDPGCLDGCVYNNLNTIHNTSDGTCERLLKMLWQDFRQILKEMRKAKNVSTGSLSFVALQRRVTRFDFRFFRMTQAGLHWKERDLREECPIRWERLQDCSVYPLHSCVLSFSAHSSSHHDAACDFRLFCCLACFVLLAFL